MENTYSIANPFIASIRERVSLSDPFSSRGTHHIVLDLHEGDFSYNVGDSIGILPENDPGCVGRIMECLRASGEEEVLDRLRKERFLLRDFLIRKANIGDLQRALVREVAHRQPNPQKRPLLERLTLPEEKELWQLFSKEYDVLDLLEAHSEVFFTAQEICDFLLPLRPRFYSIASSPRAVQSEVHLTVSSVQYEVNGKRRTGVCSRYLCETAPLAQRMIPIFVQPAHHFSLPEDPNASLIMIGPGTGVAPFRAFMQERMHRRDCGKNWLFFGECYQKTDFFYEEEWRAMVKTGKLRLSLAFSRDQAYKIYVQHRMREEGRDLFAWLEEGAYLFVCGDAQAMAKEVDAALQAIIEQHSSCNGKEYLKQLRKQGRYLRDVY